MARNQELEEVRSGTESLRVTFGALLGLSVVVLVEGFDSPPLSPSRAIALYCFAASLPIDVAVFIRSWGAPDHIADQEHAAISPPPLVWLIMWGAGIVLPVVGLGFWLWDLSPAATALFAGLSLISLLVAWPSF